VEYEIADRPESFHLVAGTRLRQAITTTRPRLWIVFAIDDEDDCTLVGIRRAEPPRVVSPPD
jgi:hypothetical protein